MKKTVFKAIAVVLALSALLCTFAYAAEARSSTYISAYSASIVPTGSGNMNFNFSITATGKMDDLGVITIRIYRADGTYVTTLNYTNTNPDRSNMLGHNSYTYSSSTPYTGVSGQSYYAELIFYAKNSSGHDYVDYTTSTVTV